MAGAQGPSDSYSEATLPTSMGLCREQPHRVMQDVRFLFVVFGLFCFYSLTTVKDLGLSIPIRKIVLPLPDSPPLLQRFPRGRSHGALVPG